jgi:galactokinase
MSGHLAEELFARTFAGRPAGVWSAPGRVNPIGEHTDYKQGLCLPIASPQRSIGCRGRLPRRSSRG